jgi:hypothetical protein
MRGINDTVVLMSSFEEITLSIRRQNRFLSWANRTTLGILKPRDNLISPIMFACWLPVSAYPQATIIFTMHLLRREHRLLDDSWISKS